MPRDATCRTIRCAIYTRKSTEEGLAQDFNSLHAQREACEAYVASQRHEGWTLLPDAFDDGGSSGGTLERPALARLLATIRKGAIDMIVVYKVDRLTRSLADFAKLVETLDAAGASFVSVTQSFNTSTSMGRLTLNMLLSFAQFEREVTAERIRDKIAASKRRGLWTGGPPPLGYDVRERALVVNQAEAVSVHRIFDGYRQLGSIRALKAALSAAGIVSKRRMARGGAERGGRPLGRGALEQMLRNPLYVGEVRHGASRYPGKQAAIIERELFDAVQAKLDANATARRHRDEASAPSLLAGMIRDATGDALTPSHASKGAGRLRYRYYVSHRLMAGHARDHPDAWRLPAPAVEEAVRKLLAKHLKTPNTLGTLAGDALSAQAQAEAGRQIADLADRVAHTPTETLRPLLIDLGLRVIIGHDAMSLDIDAPALARAIGISSAPETPRIAAATSLSLRKRGRETRLIMGDLIEVRPDRALVALLVEARDAARALMAGGHASVRALATHLGRDHRRVARSLQLAWLAPDMVEAILDGRQPASMTASSLLRLDALPTDWDAQRRMLGMA